MVTLSIILNIHSPLTVAMDGNSDIFDVTNSLNNDKENSIMLEKEIYPHIQDAGVGIEESNDNKNVDCDVWANDYSFCTVITLLFIIIALLIVNIGITIHYKSQHKSRNNNNDGAIMRGIRDNWRVHK